MEELLALEDTFQTNPIAFSGMVIVLYVLCSAVLHRDRDGKVLDEVIAAWVEVLTCHVRMRYFVLLVAVVGGC